jgi:hypothetical protein
MSKIDRFKMLIINSVIDLSRQECMWKELGLWCLTPLPTPFQ